MRTLRLNPSDFFRPLPKRAYQVSLVPAKPVNIGEYLIHWVKDTVSGRYVMFPCLRLLESPSCPLCILSKDDRELLPKRRFLVNVWQLQDPRPQVWDMSKYAFATLKINEETSRTGSSRIWDPSETGILLSFSIISPVSMTVKFYDRGYPIPQNILKNAFNLTDLMSAVDRQVYINELESVLNVNLDRQRAESVGEIFPQTERIKIPTVKPEEPEPYKKVQRIITWKEED